MSQALQVVVHTGNESKNQILDVVQGNQTTIRAVPSARYQLRNPAHKETGPDQIRSKRIGKNLHISLDDKNDAQLVIEGYYDGSTGDTSSLYGIANDGRMYEYIPEDPEPEGLVANLSDGGAPVSHALGGKPVDGVFELSALPLVAATGGIGAGWLAAGAVAAASAGGGGGSSAGATPSVLTSIEIIYSAAQNNNAVGVGAVTQAVYEDASIFGVNSSNLSLINQMLDTVNINGAAVNTTPKVQALVNAVRKVQVLANNTAGDAPIQLLTTADIQSLGLSTVLETAEDISLFNSILDKAQDTSVDTSAEVINLASISKRIQHTAKNETTSSALNAKDLIDSGLTGVTNINLADVVAAIKNQANDGSGADTLSELQALIDGVLKAGDALTVLTEFAENNTQGLVNISNAAPQIRNYSQAGVTGVDDNNLNSINDALASAAVNGEAINTILELQAVIDAYNIIKANADGMAENNTTNPAKSQYAAIGVTGVSSFATESLLGDVVDGKSFSAVDTVSEVQALADAANTVMAGASGGTVPTLAQLQLLGLSGVNANNLASIQEAIAATADNGLGVDTFAELQSVVTAAGNAALDALRAISTAAQNNTAGITPALRDFTLSGVQGVDSSNFGAISSALNSAAINGSATDTVAKVQAIVDAYKFILREANGSVADVTPNINPTAAQYAAIGASIGDGAIKQPNLNLLGAIVGNLTAAAVDTVTEINELARIANLVQTLATDGTPSPALTVADLTKIGLLRVTSSNVAIVLNAIKNTENDGSGADSLPELQATIDGVLSAGEALTVLTEFAEKNTQGLVNVSNGAPLIRNYSQAGVTGVDDNNLNSINDALASAAVNGEAINTILELQAVIDAYNIIKANADGMASNNTTNPVREQYAAIGVTGVSSFATESLLGDVVDGKSFSAVDTVSEVQALADAANTVMAGASGGTVPTLAQLQLLGLSGVNANNLASIQEAIAATADNGLGVDTFAELQSVVTAAGNAALDALRAISTAAQISTTGIASTLNVVEIESIISTRQLTLEDVLVTELTVAHDECIYAECYVNLDSSTHILIDQSMLSAYCVS